MSSANDILEKYSDCNGGQLTFSDAYGYDSTGIVDFYAFLQEFNQTFSLTYDTEEVYGRNDPISSYRNTKRTISLSWTVPSADVWDARLNHLKTRLLVRLLYPRYQNDKWITWKSLDSYDKLDIGISIRSQTHQSKFHARSSKDRFFQLYEQIENAERSIKSALASDQTLTQPTSTLVTTSGRVPMKIHKDKRMLYQKQIGSHHTQTMTENPIVRVKYANLICSANGSDGLLGYLDGLVVKPVLEEGFFTQETQAIQSPIGNRKVMLPEGSFPKVYSLSCNFNVIHDDPLGKYQGQGNMSNIFAV